MTLPLAIGRVAWSFAAGREGAEPGTMQESSQGGSVFRRIRKGTMGFFITQISHLLGTGPEPVMFKFGVVLTAIFLLAITILESGTHRS